MTGTDVSEILVENITQESYVMQLTILSTSPDTSLTLLIWSNKVIMNNNEVLELGVALKWHKYK